MKIKTILVSLLLTLLPLGGVAQEVKEFSTAGFYALPESGRNVYNFNPAWRLYKGDVEGAEEATFDDSAWQVVSLPNGIEIVPEEASGCVNYQGVVWYRKHFTPTLDMKAHKAFLHFEGIMGKNKIYLNGQLLHEHFGGYLPAIADLSKYIKWGEPNVIAVCADNTDDPLFPPGKVQEHLDFTYMGGIYRDAWFITHADTYITDPNFTDKVAGGGLLIAFDDVSEASAKIMLRLNAKNESSKRFRGKVEFTLRTPNGKILATDSKPISFKKDIDIKQGFIVKNPPLWSPENPQLTFVDIRIKDAHGNLVDGYAQRFGIRSYDFKQKDGFWLNGKPYDAPLIGGNRHQDYALVGNAVSNHVHWRDAKKMRDAGFKVVRNAHYPQDPAFMDACDELGLFVIVNTPGWQFWNKEPIFEQRVYSDIRNMVRRDRNRASVWLWEPILNETWYPANFALNTRKIVEAEFPYPNCFNACDQQAQGNEHFNIHFAHPRIAEKGDANTDLDSTKTYFTREWGDNVDDWYSHNSTSRVARNWGENAMLVQAQHYAKEEFPYSTLDNLFRVWREDRQHIGGTMWHTFDHQRGYHPDPFYGGIMDAFRQPKTAYYMFQAQQKPGEQRGDSVVKPMVYIAHEMTPFSSKDVVVYSNCDEVRLRFTDDGKEFVYKRDLTPQGMDYPIITFENVYDFMVDKHYARNGKHTSSYLLAEGYIDGKLVASDKVTPSRRPSQLVLEVDHDGADLVADGSDFITIIASIRDNNGVIKRLNNYKIIFEVEGHGELINTSETMTNPMPLGWGTAPALIRSTTTPGKVRVTARVLWEGSQMPSSATIEFETKPSSTPLLFNDKEMKAKRLNQAASIRLSTDKLNAAKADLSALEEVQKQQNDFGE